MSPTHRAVAGSPAAPPNAPRPRAAALPPDERRAAIVRATVPLLLEHGPAVTTRQIAEAAGIAEGTIFRVFPDKDAVVAAAIAEAVDPLPVTAAIRGIDRSLPLEDRLLAAVAVLQERITSVGRLMTVVGAARLPRPLPRPPHSEQGALADLLAGDADRLRFPPEEAADLLRGLTLGCTLPPVVGDRPRPPDQIVSLFLDGARTADAGPCRSLREPGAGDPAP